MTLPSPPRTLDRKLRRELWWGSPLMLVGASIVFLGILLLVLLLSVYGVGFSSLIAPLGDTVTVVSSLHEAAEEQLASGGSVPMVKAGVEVNGRTLTVKGYGEGKVGDAVTIVIPTSAPERAWLEGFNRYPVPPHRLLRVSLLLMLPGAGLMLLSLWRSFRALRLLRHGRSVLGRRTRAVPLPRPLKDMELVRWEHDGRRFWQLGARGSTDDTLLVLGRTAAAVERLLDPLRLDGETVAGGPRSWALSYRALCVLSGVTLLLALLFLAT